MRLPPALSHPTRKRSNTVQGPDGSAVPATSPQVAARVNEALTINAKQYGDDGKVLKIPLKASITFVYRKMGHEDGGGRVTESVKGYPSSWARGGDGRQVMIYKDQNMGDRPHVYVLAYMSDVVVNTE